MYTTKLALLAAAFLFTCFCQSTLGQYGPDLKVAVWLVPAPADEARLRGVIEELVRRHREDGPALRTLRAFGPHATVRAGALGATNLALDLQGLFTEIEHLAARQPVVSIEVADPLVATRDIWRQSLFLKLKPAAFPTVFTNNASSDFPLLAKLWTATDYDAPHAFMPHVSLMYLPGTDASRAQAGDTNLVRAGLVDEARKLLGDTQAIRFDRLQVVTARSNDFDRYAVDQNEKWDVIFTAQLAPPR